MIDVVAGTNLGSVSRNRDCLQMLRLMTNHNHSCPYKRVTLSISAHSEAEIRESVGRNWTYKYQSQPIGIEMPGNDDSWFSCLGEQGHLWVYWHHRYESTIFPPRFSSPEPKLIL